MTSLGNNLIGETDGSSGWVGSDLTGTIAQPLNPMLAPLGNYGGPTQTMALLRGSPAINAGNNALIPAGVTTDQRGVGYPRIVGGTVDIGAFESPYLTTVTSVSSSVNASAYGQSVTFTATISDTSGLVPAGSVEFYDGSTDIGAGSILSGGGQTATSTFTISTLGAGSHLITAVFTGTGVFDNSTGALSQTVNQSSTTTTAASASTTFGSAVQTVVLSAAVASATGLVNEGTETFTILRGGTVIGTAVNVNVSAGIASAGYELPAGLAPGEYIIQAVYGGTDNYDGSMDSSQFLTVTAAATTTAAASASATFNTAPEVVPLTATITSAGGIVNGGTETFSILNGLTVIGQPDTVKVSASTANGVYVLPAGTQPGHYTIEDVYSGTGDYDASSDFSQPLIVGAAATTTSAASVSIPFSSNTQTVALNATVTSPAGAVDQGNETFTVLNGTTPLGSPVTVGIVSGIASASYTLPAGAYLGTYTIEAVFSGTIDFATSTDTSQTLTIAAGSAPVPYPDLQVANISGPSTGFGSQAALVSWTDENEGTYTATGPWVDNVYAATDAQGDNPTLLGSFEFDGTLAVGASVQLTQQVNLPANPGTYWLMVTTNATQSVQEGANFGNDTTVAASSIAVNAVPLPDLVVSSITPPPNGVFSGTSVPISFVVTNQGTAPTSVPVWHDWVILSQDPTLAQTYQGQLNPTGPGGDQTLNNQPVIEGFANPSYLGVGQSYQQNVDVTLPITAQGTWYVYVVPDGTGLHHPFAMPELSRTDKLAISAGFSVTLSPPPELDVTSVQAPAENFSGQPMNLSWTVANIGTGPTDAGTWTDAVYMSPDPVLDSNATELGTFTHQGVLAAGSSYTNTQTRQLPGGRQRLVLLHGPDRHERPGVPERRDGQQRGRHVHGRDREPDAAARPGSELDHRRRRPPWPATV